MYTHEQVISFANIMANSRRAVFFGGAGVSTESGIPEFAGRAVCRKVRISARIYALCHVLQKAYSGVFRLLPPKDGLLCGKAERRPLCAG